MPMHGYAWLCRVMYSYVRPRRVIVYGYVWLCRVVYAYVGSCMPMHAYVYPCRVVYAYVGLGMCI